MRGMKTEWVPLAFTDSGMLNGILISACRDMFALYGSGPYIQFALQYKASCISSLKEAILTEESKPSDASIAKAILLAGDEV
jgi:hypothetical protein